MEISGLAARSIPLGFYGRSSKLIQLHSGGVTNGNDLVSAYARQSPHFPGPVAEFGIAMAETGDRPQRYEKHQIAVTLGIVWQVLKAVFMGFGKGKQE